MKILVYSSTFLAPTMTFIYNEVVNLAKSHEVLVLCNNRLNTTKFPFDPYIVLNPPHVVERVFFFLLRKIYWGKSYLFSQSKQLNSIIESFEPDLIHAHFGSAGLTILDNIKDKQLPIVVSFHGVDASAAMRRKTYRQMISRLLKTRGVYPILVSNFMREKFRSLNFKISKSHVLYYGINTSLFKRTKKPVKSPYIFLQVASFRPKKGQEYTIRAFHKLVKTKKDVRLIFIGTGSLLDKCRNLVNTLNISDLVEFRGLKGQVEIIETLDQAHCFVHHSITPKDGNQEGIPNAIMEAMSMELPIISTYHSGIPELVEHNENGFLVAERDVEAYAERMKEIMNWNYLLSNRQKIIQFFDEKQHTKQLSQIFKEIINPSK